MRLWDSYKHTRRCFIGTAGGVAGAALVVEWIDSRGARADTHGSNSQKVQFLSPGPGWIDRPGSVKHRYDGLVKVTGQKIYGRDFRVRDMEGWPQDELRLALLRVTQADCVFAGVDVSRFKRSSG